MGNADHTLTNRLTSLLSCISPFASSFLPSFFSSFLPSFLPSFLLSHLPPTTIPCLERNPAVLFLSALHGALKITDSPSIPLLRRKIIALFSCPGPVLRPAFLPASYPFRCIFDLQAIQSFLNYAFTILGRPLTTTA